MPLVASAFCAYAAGLLLGFGGAIVPGVGAAVLGGMLAAASRWATGVLLAGTLAAGVVTARSASVQDERCARAIRSRHEAIVRLRTPLAPGRPARGTMAGAWCRVDVRVQGRRVVAGAGSLVLVRGDFTRRGRALGVRDAEVHVLAAPRRLDRWRAAAGTRIDALYGSDAPLARALLLADDDDVDRALRDRFADAGIIHMLSVSGLHVGIIAGAVRAGTAGVRAGAIAAELVALGTAVAFVLFIGAPPPAVRSVAMLALIAVARLLQRPTSIWGIWAVSCAVSLAEPRVVLDLGWQLSVTGMAGLLASAGVAGAWRATLRGPARTVVDGMVATTVASAATAPLVAWVFGRVSLAAVVTNVAAAPLFGIAQPLLFATLVLAPLAAVPARFLADAARAVLAAIDVVARAGAALPWAAVRAEPDALTAIALAAAAAGLVVAAAGRWPRRPLAVSLGALAIASWRPMIPAGGGRLELHALDVGQGDALALRTPRGRWILVDAGGAWRTGDAAATTILPYLRRRGGDVVLLVTSHPHLDHIGGARRLLERLAIDTLWDGAHVAPSAAYREMLEATRTRGTAWRRVAAGDTATIDGVGLRVLAPDPRWMATLQDPNDASVVLRVTYGAVRLLLTGDAEAQEERWLVARYGEELRASVLKVAHHGSATSSTEAFLDAVRPRVALVSVGTGNMYGHPSPDVLRRIDALGAHLLRTDDEGTIVVSTDGAVLDVNADQLRWRYFGRP